MLTAEILTCTDTQNKFLRLIVTIVTDDFCEPAVGDSQDQGPQRENTIDCRNKIKFIVYLFVRTSVKCVR